MIREFAFTVRHLTNERAIYIVQRQLGRAQGHSSVASILDYLQVSLERILGLAGSGASLGDLYNSFSDGRQLCQVLCAKAIQQTKEYFRIHAKRKLKRMGSSKNRRPVDEGCIPIMSRELKQLVKNHKISSIT